VTYRRKIKVNCDECGHINEEDTEFIDIEEGMMGEDILTFKCPICKKTKRSKRFG